MNRSSKVKTLVTKFSFNLSFKPYGVTRIRWIADLIELSFTKSSTLSFHPSTSFLDRLYSDVEYLLL